MQRFKIRQIRVFLTMLLQSPARELRIHRPILAVFRHIRPYTRLLTTSKPFSLHRIRNLPLNLLITRSFLSKCAIPRCSVRDNVYGIILATETRLTGYNSFRTHQTNRCGGRWLTYFTREFSISALRHPVLRILSDTLWLLIHAHLTIASRVCLPTPTNKRLSWHSGILGPSTEKRPMATLVKTHHRPRRKL